MGYRRKNKPREKLVKWIAVVSILIFISIYSIGQSENVHYVNGDYFLNHHPDVITPGVDPTTGTITCGAYTGNFANCGTGKWPAYNELLALAWIIAFLSAIIVVPYDFLKSKKNARTVLFAAIISVLIPIPIPPIISFIEGSLINGVQSTAGNDFDTPREIFKFVPAFIVIGGLTVSIPAISTALCSIFRGTKTTKKRRSR